MSNRSIENELRIIPMLQHPTVQYAASELSDYLQRMSPDCRIEYGKGTGDGEVGLRLGRFADIGLTVPLESPDLDDAVFIDVNNGEGVIAGSNERSVLFAVYRFLEEAGCRWVRPGPDGELVPARSVHKISVKRFDQASFRHRGLCIEGAVSYENMLDNIRWAPKVGFNAYFLEFKTPYTFFDRWYSHRHNPYKKPEPVTVEQVDEFTKKLEAEIVKRGLVYHAVGHGWTGEPFDLPCLGWDSVNYTVDKETAVYLAQVNGKRELWHGVPLNTQLCYSNPEARRRLVQYAADHAEANPHIGMLHLWLADAFNNHCECESCSNTLPSDFYIMLLNELDEELTARGIDMKVVFLLYLDLLWEPQTETLHNKDRFVLLFAPISRTYSRSYDADTTGVTLSPYVRNQLKFPRGIRENVAFLRAWQRLFEGDSFAYEYHHMWDHYYDPGYSQMAAIISEDVKNLRKLGLNGIISDQTQRSFFPTGLGMHVLARTLWNEKEKYETIADDFYAAAFGEDAQLCREYLEKLSDLFDPPYMRGEKPRVSEEAVNKLGQVSEVVRAFHPVIRRNLDRGLDACQMKSWSYLSDHAELVVRLASALQARAEGNMAVARERWLETADWAQRNEDRIQPDFDVFLFIQTLQKEFQEKVRTNFGGELT